MIQSATPLTSPVIFYNATIYTMDAARPTATVLATCGQNIAYISDDVREAKRLLPHGARLVDLGGNTVIPGIIEGHMHFLSQGRVLSEIDIFLKPKEEILHIIAREAAARPEGAWITGRGWNHETWPEKAWPCKEDLDAIAPRHPVALTRIDGHSLWANSMALALANIHANTPDMPGGEIFRTASGELQGILVDTPMFKVWKAMPEMSEDEAIRACNAAEKELFSLGVTSLVNASQTLQHHEYLKKAYETGHLAIRVYEMLAAHRRDDITYVENGGKPFENRYGERLTMRAMKTICDGSLGSRSAWFLEEYADRPGHTGNPRYTDEELLAIANRAKENGFQLCLHAIGDAAARQAVRVMGAAFGNAPFPERRWRIEHLQTVTAADLAEALRLGIVPAMQSIHEVSDRNMALARLGPKRCAHSYGWRAVIDAGGVFANGSDAPMEKVNPFLGLHAAVAREPECAALSRDEALRSFTLWSAYAQFAETRKGSLETGKLADFAVLDRDIMACPAGDIAETRVLMTVLGGEVVYEG